MSEQLQDYRVHAAIGRCLDAKLLTIGDGRTRGAAYEPTSAGQEWLARDPHARIAALVDPWRERPTSGKTAKARRQQKLVAVMDGEFVQWDGDPTHSPWMPDQLRWGHDPTADKIDWRAAVVDALDGDDGESFHVVDALLSYHAQVNNPLLARRLKGTYGPRPKVHHLFGWRRHEATELELEQDWYNLLAQTIERTLLPRGAVEMGWDGHALSIRLHAIGRYMLGVADTFEYEAQPEGSVIVQPNFDIVFMGPSPTAEAALGRLAERTGQRMGAIFHITRASILAAAAAGIACADALRDMERMSAKPVPDNVRREVTGWFNSTAQVAMRQAWLIEAPDEVTAARVLSSIGKNTRCVAPTLIEVEGKRNEHAAMIRKPKTAGIFVR